MCVLYACVLYVCEPVFACAHVCGGQISAVFPYHAPLCLLLDLLAGCGDGHDPITAEAEAGGWLRVGGQPWSTK